MEGPCFRTVFVHYQVEIKMKIIVVFLFALVAIAAATEEEDQAFEEYLVKNKEKFSEVM